MNAVQHAWLAIITDLAIERCQNLSPFSSLYTLWAKHQNAAEWAAMLEL